MPADILTALWAHPANRDVLTTLEGQAVPAATGDIYVLDGFELHTHPDLDERLDALAVGEPGGRSIGLYGVPALVAAGVIYAVARGTNRIDLRIASEKTRETIIQHGGDATSDFGADWVSADAWLSDLHSETGTELLRGWIAEAGSVGESRRA